MPFDQIQCILQLIRNSHSLFGSDCFTVMQSLLTSMEILQLTVQAYPRFAELCLVCVKKKNGSNKAKCIWQVALRFETQFYVKKTQPLVVVIKAIDQKRFLSKIRKDSLDQYGAVCCELSLCFPRSGFSKYDTVVL